MTWHQDDLSDPFTEEFLVFGFVLFVVLVLVRLVLLRVTERFLGLFGSDRRMV
jgi:hypothetical protein